MLTPSFTQPKHFQLLTPTSATGCKLLLALRLVWQTPSLTSGGLFKPSLPNRPTALEVSLCSFVCFTVYTGCHTEAKTGLALSYTNPPASACRVSGVQGRAGKTDVHYSCPDPLSQDSFALQAHIVLFLKPDLDMFSKLSGQKPRTRTSTLYTGLSPTTAAVPKVSTVPKFRTFSKRMYTWRVYTRTSIHICTNLYTVISLY